MKKYIIILSLALLLGGCGKQASDMHKAVNEDNNTEIEDYESTADTEIEDYESIADTEIEDLESIVDTEIDTDTTIGIEDDIVQEDITDGYLVSEISSEIAGKYVIWL